MPRTARVNVATEAGWAPALQRSVDTPHDWEYLPLRIFGLFQKLAEWRGSQNGALPMGPFWPTRRRGIE